MREKRKTHGAMTLEDIINIDEKIGLLCERGAPALVPERYAHLVIATKMARRMAYHPEIANFGYIQELLQSKLPKTTAGRIVNPEARDASGTGRVPVGVQEGEKYTCKRTSGSSQ